MPAPLKAFTATALIGISTLSLSPPAEAGWGCGWGCGFGPAIAGFGIGAIVGGVLAAPPIYVWPPPPPVYYGPSDYGPYYGPTRYGPSYYGPVGYGPQPRTPDWYGNHSSPTSKTSPRATADAPRSRPSRSAKTTVPTGLEHKVEIKFKAAQEKAKRDGVYALTKEDIDGLSPEQIKQLRGY